MLALQAMDNLRVSWKLKWEGNFRFSVRLIMIKKTMQRHHLTIRDHVPYMFQTFKWLRLGREQMKRPVHKKFNKNKFIKLEVNIKCRYKMSHAKYAYFNILHKGAFQIHFSMKRLKKQTSFKKDTFFVT